MWDALSAAAECAAGATHVFLSGPALSNSRGLPDDGLLPAAEVVRQIVDAAPVEVMVDLDTSDGATLARAVDLIIESGAGAVMLEHQHQTRQSKGAVPGLCRLDVMSARIEQVVERSEAALEVLARTDSLPTMDFDDSLARLHAYVESGATWVVPVQVPSEDDLAAAIQRFPKQS